MRCGEPVLYTVVIQNDTIDKSVSYVYNYISDTLTIQTSKTYEVKAYTQPPKNIVDQNGIASIKLNRNGMTGNYSFQEYNFDDDINYHLN